MDAAAFLTLRLGASLTRNDAHLPTQPASRTPRASGARLIGASRARNPSSEQRRAPGHLEVVRRLRHFSQVTVGYARNDADVDARVAAILTHERSSGGSARADVRDLALRRRPERGVGVPRSS